MTQSNSALPVVRFKFMPTPSGRLHIGHAWLLFVMQAIGEALRRRGQTVELLLVLDEININFSGNAPEGTREVGEGIVRDMERLGISPDRTVWNDKACLAETLQDPRIDAIALEKWRSELGMPPRQLLHNAALDARLGITHIIRGDELRLYKEVYEECYEKLGCKMPALDYIPFVRRSNGEKIGSHHGAYVIENVLASMSVDELFCLLVGQCIRREQQTEPLPDRATALQRLLGDRQWADMADLKDETARASFFARFADDPRIEIENQRCVAVE